jgi:hypothetical protein
MFERIPGVADGIDAFRIVGTLTREDYEKTVEPLLDEARRQDRRLRLLVQMGPEYEGFTAGAVVGKTDAWLRFPSLMRMIDGYAVVSDVRWIREWIHLMGSWCRSRCGPSASTSATTPSPGCSRSRRALA